MKQFIQNKLVRHLNEKLSGSGIDAGWTDGPIRRDSVVIKSSWHCVDEHGFYDGWQDFQIVIPLDNYEEFKLQFTGRMRKRYTDLLREHLEDIIYSALTEYFDYS